MAFSFTLAQGGTLIIPDSAVNINVANSPSGNSTSGVVVLVGEADEGPSWSQDQAAGSKLSLNTYGVGDLLRVQSKYGSGNIVDAFRGIVSPSASPRITGGPQTVILVKTNNSSQASYETADDHGTFQADLGGELGDQIQESVTSSQPEQAPSTGNFSYIPNAAAAALAARVNGGAVETLSISANTSPSALASALSALANLNAVGGVNRNILQGLSGQNIQLQVNATPNVTISLASPNVFAFTPQVGDTMNIPAGSVLEGAGNANVGWYLVTSVSNVSGSASIGARLMSGSPVAVSPVAISGTPNNDLIDYSSIQINDMSGTNRSILTGVIGQNITVSVAGSSLTATLAAGQVFNGLPTAGDLVYIPSGSAYEGGGNANVGWYQVTLVSNTTAQAFIQMSRLSNGSPVAVSATAVVALSDIQDYDPQIKGLGKSMEIYDNTGAVNISSLFLSLGVNSPAPWISQLQVSSAELQKTINIIRNSTNSSESYVVGGNISLQLGYAGTSGSVTIAKVSGVLMLTTSIVGGAGANLSLNLSKIATISDLVSKINANTGYSAAVGSNADGQRNPSVLDNGTFNIASSLGNRPARIKRDLYDLTLGQSGLSASALVTYIPEAVAGLPIDNSPVFLSGGAKGGTTGLQFSQAIDALQGVRTNFVVPLVSQDASLDIAANLTDPSSTYTVDAVNAAVKSHCLAMSTAKVKRHRIGLVSKRGTFAQAQSSAQTMATFRIAHLFQDIIDLNSQGQLQQFQPWMGSVKAAGMQAAGAYKAIFNKTINISGAIQAAGDFDDENSSQVEQALLAGLIPVQMQETGGFTFVSDQLTYSLDNNFVYNSLQAVYVADLMALDLASSLKNAFVGESVADVTPGTAESFVKAKMAEYLARKYTVSSPQQGAPGGWKSISISITPGVLSVNVVALEATSIYFIPINLDIEGINASTSATGA